MTLSKKLATEAGRAGMDSPESATGFTLASYCVLKSGAPVGKTLKSMLRHVFDSYMRSSDGGTELWKDLRAAAACNYAAASMCSGSPDRAVTILSTLLHGVRLCSDPHQGFAVSCVCTFAAYRYATVRSKLDESDGCIQLSILNPIHSRFLTPNGILSSSPVSP